jgi:hypothetical protein
MAKNEINQELFNLARSLLAFATVLYKLYKPYIKWVIITLLGYAAFKIGRMTIIDSLEQSVTKLWTILTRRADYTIFIPERIKKVERARKIILFFLILSAAIWITAYSLKIKTFRKTKLKYVVIYMLTLTTSLAVIWAYEVILNMRVKAGRSQDMTIN